MKFSNHIKYSTLLLLSSFLTINLSCTTDKHPRLGESPVQEVIDAMTIEEKSLMVTGAKRREVVPVPLPGRKQKNITAVGGYTYPFVHLGIPSIMLSDGPAGLRIAPRRPNDPETYYCTAFPVGTLVASSWDPQLVEKVGNAMGHEALEYGVDILLSPAMNIHRDPLGGRSFEYYSEDPLISGKMGAALVRGIQSQGIGTAIKHFVANNQETNRRTIDAVVSERALREIYLRGFEIAVKEGDPWTVMSSYNKVNGTYTPQSEELLEIILRKEWGFDGFVLTDWYGGDDPVEQMKAGNDLLMPGLQDWSDAIAEALENGSLEKELVDRNIARILDVITRTSTYKDYPYSNKPNFKESIKIAREAAGESMVLLKNDADILPLKPDIKKVAPFGNYSYKLTVGGTGSGMVNNEYSISLAQGLENAGYEIDAALHEKYTDYLKKGKPQNLEADSLITAMPKPDSILGELPLDASLIRQNAEESDIAMVSIMRVFGEGGDRKLETFYLTEEEKNLLKNVSEAFRAKGKKVVVVLNIGGVIETASWRELADAILLAWQPGQEGGNAMADILTGKVNPSGKLATTFPLDYPDVPTTKNFPGTPAENPEKVVHEEGIYVGYRYYDSFAVNPAYEFGFGLSYTDFSYDNLKLGSETFENEIEVTADIKNTGNKAGREVVQLYLAAPGKAMDKPVKELKNFAKTKLLAPGESQTITFVLDARSLASFVSERSAWIAEAGKYTVHVGASSRDIRKSAGFDLEKELTVEKVHKVLVPQEKISEFKRK
ncbi:glycoside hydrolase family 3 C-terminal domain-containing protein [Echinicola vietnamensis]|uniref:Beta-glucosidase-like glycosyl hydrolase n=1 Tax=Echinicola vietnamensis (strain DSM 17526 / LMG 23754 / KMM 6221) TaxID=926556 RepID=L0FVA3_ECHVK|nr:glycoside hydrolase family 3 C-terminal domain-containing protein [Echinicola vietnamensis]AGA76686.1 beta-glucosidase-like glycosyl hydrolase [Echinicola vietnamensis DSM 17526]